MTPKERYKLYLASDHWARLKVRATEVWGGSCFVCTKNPVDFHHLVYRTPFELGTPDDVVPLCRDCHSGAHFSGEAKIAFRAMRNNDERRAALKQLLTKGIVVWNSRCTEAPRDLENLKVRLEEAERNRHERRLREDPCYAGMCRIRDAKRAAKQSPVAISLRTEESGRSFSASVPVLEGILRRAELKLRNAIKRSPNDAVALARLRKKVNRITCKITAARC